MSDITRKDGEDNEKWIYKGSKSCINCGENERTYVKMVCHFMRRDDAEAMPFDMKMNVCRWKAKKRKTEKRCIDVIENYMRKSRVNRRDVGDRTLWRSMARVAM